MDRDIIITVSDYDITWITLNGIEIGSGIERGYETGSIFIELFNKLEHSYNKPIILDLFIEKYFSDGEYDAFWNRAIGTNRLFTDDELQVLYETEDKNKFIEKVQTNLYVEASRIDKTIQEM